MRKRRKNEEDDEEDDDDDEDEEYLQQGSVCTAESKERRLEYWQNESVGDAGKKTYTHTPTN